MKRVLFLSFFVIGLLVASEPDLAGPASGAAAPVCPICMEQVDLTLAVNNPRAAVTTTPLFGCDHPEYFHANCLAQLLQANGAQTRCPMCRRLLFAHLPAIIQAALPDFHPAPVQPALPAPAPAVAAPVLAPAAIAEPIIVPAHVTDINQIRHHYDARANASSLNLENLGITTIDGIVFEQINKQWPNLQMLNLIRNPLTALPPEIGQLQNLQTLLLRSTPLQNLPAEVGQLQNLRELELRETQIAVLPAEIRDLHNLQSLWLGFTPLIQNPNWPGIRAQLWHDLPNAHIFGNYE